jgi:flagellar motor switch protein FliN/FliY
MIIDQDEIEQLLNEAQAFSSTAEDTAQATIASAGAMTSSAQKIEQRKPSNLYANAGEEVKRILRMRVPVLVRLSERPMTIGRIRELSAGSILEFNKHVESDLELYIRNCPIGKGTAVKIGENYGLRVNKIEPRRARVDAMGQ